MAKHTPGPFVAEIPRWDDRHMCRIYAPRAGGYMQVGATWHPKAVVSAVSLSREECMANARLFAASHRLLEAARHVIGLHDALDGDMDNDVSQGAIDELEAAIAEAEGGS